MTHPCAEAERADLRGEGRAAEKRLLLENARLRRECAEAKDLISRHELALREGDHRIKNSLQIVASLMGLQERREINPVAKHALHAATARILAVARIHDALQLTGGNDLVDLGALLKTMCRTLHEMAGDAPSVNVTVDAISLQAPIALAQPSVLAANELIVNALRHAFVGRESGAIHVSLVHLQGELRIVVADDGRGLPDDYLQGRGYGLKLVRTMIAKIGGTLEVESKNGARFTLTAPTPAFLTT